MSSFELEAVEKIPADIKAAELLRNSIIAGDFSPGDRITEESLSRQMKLSRATVRLALHHLSTEGLVALKPYSGWSVVELTSKDAWELTTLRASLERTACLLVTRGLTKAVGAEIRKAYENLVTVCKSPTASTEDISQADFDLHTTIIHLCDNERLISHYTLIDRQIRGLIRSSNALMEEPETVIDQHKPIVQAILAGEADKAGLLMEEHNLSTGEKLTDLLSSMELEQEELSG